MGRGDRAPGPGRHRPGGQDRRGLSAPAVGRDAAAGDDRDRAQLRPEAPDRGRADHRARRHHPGPDPGAAGPAEARAGHGADADHPRPRHGGGAGRPGGGDVCRAGGRDRAGARHPAAAEASLHPRACWPRARCRASAAAGSTRSRARCPARRISPLGAPSPTAVSPRPMCAAPASRRWSPPARRTAPPASWRSRGRYDQSRECHRFLVPPPLAGGGRGRVCARPRANG